MVVERHVGDRNESKQPERFQQGARIGTPGDRTRPDEPVRGQHREHDERLGPCRTGQPGQRSPEAPRSTRPVKSNHVSQQRGDGEEGEQRSLHARYGGPNDAARDCHGRSRRDSRDARAGCQSRELAGRNHGRCGQCDAESDCCGHWRDAEGKDRRQCERPERRCRT